MKKSTIIATAALVFAAAGLCSCGDSGGGNGTTPSIDAGLPDATIDTGAPDSGNNGPANAASGVDCAAPWQGTAEVSETFRDAYGVHEVAYTFDQADDVVRMDFLDESSNSLTVAEYRTEELVPGEPQEPVLYLQRPSGEVFRVTSRVNTVDDYERRRFARTEVSRDGELVFQIWHVIDDDRRELDRLWYAVPEPGDGPDGTAYYTQEGTRYAVLPVVEDARIIDGRTEEEFRAWFDHYGIPETFEGEGDLSAAGVFADPQVLEQMLSHGRYCLEEVDQVRLGELPLCWGGAPAPATGVYNLKLKPCEPVDDSVTTFLTVVQVGTAIAGGIGAIANAGAKITVFDEALGFFARLERELVRAAINGVNWVNTMWGIADGASGLFTKALKAAFGGDPHVRTFDGLAFDFQGAGDFVTLESGGPDPIVVHSRLEPWGAGLCTGISVSTAVAIVYNGQVVSADIGSGSRELRIDGTVVDQLDGNLAIPEGGMLYERGGHFELGWPDGTRIEVSVRPSWINLEYAMSTARLGNVRGLMGTFDDDWSNDLTTRDGTVLPTAITLDEFYAVWGASYRLDDAESLLPYGPGENVDTFAIENFPNALVAADFLEREAADSARRVCEEVGVSEGEWMDACIVDVGCTSDDAFADFLRRLDEAEAAVDLMASPPSTTGDIELVGPPKNLLPGGVPRASIYAFREVRGAELPQPLSVDRVAPGVVADSADLEQISIEAGGRIDSYMLHLDPGALAEGSVSGSITFNVPIAGLVLLPDKLDATDGQLGARGTVYPRRADRALELGDDRVEISDDRLTVTVELDRAGWLDQLRIITVASPAQTEVER